MNEPLASRLRPKSLDEIIGQSHLIGPNGSIRKLLERGKLQSMILGGPPGTGKTTLAEVISQHVKINFIRLNATSASVKDIRNAATIAKTSMSQVVVFFDECHRASRVQEDAFLPYVESGDIIFIGATTENIFFSVHGPLISRSLLFTLEPLDKKSILKLIHKVINFYRDNGRNIEMEPEAALYIVNISSGDGRKAISIAEASIEITDEDLITKQIVEVIAPSKYYAYSQNMKYDLASAYQGSIQASDPDAAVYWLAKWLESGEDPRYIARRLLVSAAEDAFSNPLGIAVANAAYTAAANVGRPECDIVLSAATIMVATSKRDKSAAMAIWEAVKDVRENEDVAIPKEMRDCHYAGAKELGHGAYHDGKNQEAYIGINKKYYKPW